MATHVRKLALAKSRNASKSETCGRVFEVMVFSR
jgi:hypothetical protein